MKSTLFLLLLFPIFSAYGQSDYFAANTTKREPNAPTPATLKGRVYNEDTGKPLRRAEIQLLKVIKNEGLPPTTNAQLTQGGVTAVSDDSGNITFTNVEPGQYYAKIGLPGFLNPKSFNSQFGNYEGIELDYLDRFFQRITVVDGIPEQITEIRAKQGASIGGKITFADGDPATGVDVQLLFKGEYGWEPGETGIGKSVTDDRGYYRFSGLAAGEYTVCATQKSTVLRRFSTGKISDLTTYYGGLPMAGGAKSIVVVPPSDLSEINITLPDSGVYSISGTVLSKSTNKPLNRALVRYEKTDDNDFVSFIGRYNNDRSVTTDAEGKWKIEDLPAGKYVLITSYRNDEDSDEIDLPEQKTKKPIERLSEVRTNIEITDKSIQDVSVLLTSAATVSGTVTFDDDTVPGSIGISLYDVKKGYSESDWLQTDDLKKARTAKFSIAFVSPGSYRITAYGSSNVRIKSGTLGNQDILSSEITVKEGESITDIKIVVSSDIGTLEGTVILSDGTQRQQSRVVLVPCDATNKWHLYAYGQVMRNNTFVIKAPPREYYVLLLSLSELRRENLFELPDSLEKFLRDAPKIKVKAGETARIELKR